MQGLASQDATFASKVAARAFDLGVIIETSGANDEVLRLLPALTIEDDELRRGLEIIDQSVAEVLAADESYPTATAARGARVLKFGSR